MKASEVKKILHVTQKTINSYVKCGKLHPYVINSHHYEYDEDEGHIEQKANNKFIIDGMTPLEELEERFEISFGEVPVETINGYLISKMERIPAEKDRFSINVDGYNFKVIEVENKMIKKVVVAKQSDINKKDENL